MASNEIFRRLRSCIGLKAVGSTLLISFFFIAYFFVLERPFFQVRTMPISWLDNALPIVPWTAWFYFSLWVYICLPSSLMHTHRALRYYGLGTLILGVSGLTIFILIPTQVPSWEVDWSQYAILAFLKESDASGNACPSLHVAFSVFAACWNQVVLRSIGAARFWQLGNVIWCCAIALSTMTTKQHVLIDVIFGALLGGVVYELNRRIAARNQVAF